MIFAEQLLKINLFSLSAFFAMGKTKTSKKSSVRDEKSKIELATDDDFIKLMEMSKVEPLETISEESPPQNIDFSNDNSIAFDTVSDWMIEHKLLKINTKFAGTEKKKKKIAARQRQRLTPGFVPDIEIDLHGLSRDRTRQIIRNVFALQSKEKYRSVLIITGRGLNSGKEGGILKKFVWNWLKDNQHRQDYRFKLAPKFLGGGGAIIVFFN